MAESGSRRCAVYDEVVEVIGAGSLCPPPMLARAATVRLSVAHELQAVIQGPSAERLPRILVLLEWARKWNDVDGRMQRAMAA